MAEVEAKGCKGQAQALDEIGQAVDHSWGHVQGRRRERND